MKLFKGLAYVSALVAAAALAKPRVPGIQILLWPYKLLGGALAPILALITGLGAVIGLIRRDWRFTVAGAAGAALAAKFLSDIPDSEREFSAAFGDDWDIRARAASGSSHAPRRWSLRAIRPDGVVWQRDVTYAPNPRTGAPLLADVWAPAPGTRPSGLAIVYVHGGGWSVGFKDMGTRTFFRRLAGNGHVVMDIAYCLWPKAQIPLMVSEVKQAVLWMKENSAVYCVDPDRVVLMGGSAGGHLALLSAYTPDHRELPPLAGVGDTSVRGVIAYYPPVCFLSLREYIHTMHPRRNEVWSRGMNERTVEVLVGGLMGIVGGDSECEPGYRDFLAALLGGGPDECPETYRLLSPISHVSPRCPPTLLLQGADDCLVLASGARRLHRALREAGATSVLAEFPHADHAFDLVLPRVSPVAQAATHDVERFLALLA
jgi:acetyl esterase/lipase